MDGRGLIWVDGRGLDAPAVAQRAVEVVQRHGIERPRAGVANTAIAAAVAATHGPSSLVTVPADTDAEFLARFPLAVLELSSRLTAAFTDVGVATCGDLARLTREAVEVRFGADGVACWRLARADDPRQIFAPAPRMLPSASLGWEEYALRDPERLLFVANRLVAAVCVELQSWGEVAHALTIGLTLADRTMVERPLRASRATANRTVWTRLIRLELDRLRLTDGVVGLTLRVDAAGATDAYQGDVFDRGFQTAHAVDQALDRLHEDGQVLAVEPATSAHALPDRRVRWHEHAARAGRPDVGGPDVGVWSDAPQLILQLFPEPRGIVVHTSQRGDVPMPVRFRAAGREITVLTTIGPDHISGGTETGAPYAREYFTCLTNTGLLMLVFHDALADRWYLHGWWD